MVAGGPHAHWDRLDPMEPPLVIAPNCAVLTNTRDTPVEALERAFPMRIRRYGLRRGSGGAGAAPGGEGIVKEWEFLEDVTVSLVTERRSSRPWGLEGGSPGAVGENWLLREGDE